MHFARRRKHVAGIVEEHQSVLVFADGKTELYAIQEQGLTPDGITSVQVARAGLIEGKSTVRFRAAHEITLRQGYLPAEDGGGLAVWSGDRRRKEGTKGGFYSHASVTGQNHMRVKAIVGGVLAAESHEVCLRAQTLPGNGPTSR